MYERMVECLQKKSDNPKLDIDQFGNPKCVHGDDFDDLGLGVASTNNPGAWLGCGSGQVWEG